MKTKLLFSFCALLLLIVLHQPLQAQAWKLLGNSGTNPATQFLGTTDNTSLTLRTNNIERLRILNKGNVGIGLKVPEALLNVAAGNNVNLSSTDNFLLGSITDYNLAFDNNELQARHNGSGSLLSLNSWGGAVSIGNHNSPAIYAASNGKVGIGNKAVAIDYSLTVHASAFDGGILITDAIDNTAISATKSGNGYTAYFSKTNAFSGSATVYSTNAGSGEGVYGYSRFGNGVYGSTGSAQSNGDYAGYFNGAVYANGGYISSDQKLKQNIIDFSSAMEIINKLHPKQYQFRQDGNYKLMNLPEGNHYGLIAQEVEKVLPGLVKDSKFKTSLSNPQLTEEEAKNSETINFKALNYIEIIPILIKGMQEQQSLIEKLLQQNNYLQKQVNELKSIILSGNSAQSRNAVTVNNALLEQNIPNPFSNTTIINYTIPQQYSSAKIILTDKSGKILKEINITGSAKGSLNVDASILASGAYNYSLYVDERLIDSKRMMLTK